MEYVIANVTKKEIEKLNKEKIDWYPDFLDSYSNDIIIDGDKKYYEEALRIIGRISD